MNTEKFKGVFPAFYACYDDNGEISAERTQLLAKHLMEKGVKGLYVGGLTGLVKKPGSSNNFDTFYHNGTLKVQQAPGAVGYLFGDMVKDGIYQQAYYHGPSAAASELTGRLAGNFTFEAAVEEEIGRASYRERV